MNARTFTHAVSLEIRTLLSYRVDFWMSFLLGVLTFVVANYFLWEAVFRTQGAEVIRGYTLPDMVLYTLLVGCVMRVSFGSMKGAIAQDIYTGGINKYLVFPVSFQGFKYAAHLAYGLVSLAQLALALALARVLLGPVPFGSLDPALFAVGVVASLVSGYLYFAISALMEMVAFWADNVWSLGVMLRFITMFLGGGLAPLALFPDGARAALAWTPFPYILSFPVRCLQGKAAWSEVAWAMPQLGAWSLLATIAVALLYRRGLRTYSGVGI